MLPPSASASSVSRKGRSSSAGVKRPISNKGQHRRAAKSGNRRVILRDYGKPIYKASSRVALLAALESCIEGQQSLHKAAFLHRDISINNLMINEDDENPSRRSFLIDLDLAIRTQREGATAREKQAQGRSWRSGHYC
ncbi:hypothetical protein BKA56DRAFT_696895 [Ilyonectria sp. MPI-CAGE-AT-0026]|nr:hypothetical protein BKA56DRAFT_696895 [Ilyonectria sp. MPI-CAGE-AT-0026]